VQAAADVKVLTISTRTTSSVAEIKDLRMIKQPFLKFVGQ